MKTFNKTLWVLSIVMVLFFGKNIFGTNAYASMQEGGIEFTFVPGWGGFDDLTGRVWGVNPSEYNVAVYIFIESAGGWWTKPYAIAPLTSIKSDSTWTTNITTGGIDQYATRIIAFLVPEGYDPPPCLPCNELPASLLQYPYSIECRIPGTRVISFSGYNWIVKKSDEPIGVVGPGPNLFSDDQEDVWVDEEGLHLTIAKDGDDWYATEVVADRSLGYGTYVFDVKGRIDLLDENLVLGLFTWDDCAPFDSLNPNEYFREIDIEFSRWGDAPAGENAQYVVQPYYIPENMYRFNIQLSGDQPVSTHKFTWSEDSIHFKNIYGNTQKEWIYTGEHIPLPGSEKPRINFWMFEGLPPSNGEEAEVIITDFEYFPQYCILTLEANPEEGGSVTGEGEYNMGDEITLTATANEGFEFVNWTCEAGEEVSDEAEFIYIMPANDVTITANFGKSPENYTVIFYVVDEEGNDIENATVTLGDVENEAGEYIFENINPGTHNYKVKHENYFPVEEEVEVVDKDKTVSVEMVINDTFVNTPEDVELKVFPNPARDIFYVESNEIIKQIRLVNISGQVIKDIAVDGFCSEINVNNLRSGVYFIAIYTTKSIYTEHIQISR